MSGPYLVTGGAGFIGAHLVELLAAGEKVVVLDNFANGNFGRLAAVAGHPRLKVIEADIRDSGALAAALAGAGGVFHLAAMPLVPECVRDWLGSHGVNGTATLQLFELARRAGPVPVVYASSAAVYGDRGEARCAEDMPLRPVSPYGADKLACESHAHAFWYVHRLPSAGLRFFNVYGPGQGAASPYSGVLARFVDRIASGRPVEIHGDGLQSCDFVHVADAVDALRAAMDRITRDPDALVSNVCTGTSQPVRDIANLIGDVLLRRPVHMLHGPARPGDIRHSLGDPGYMARTLGLGPLTPVEQGLAAWLGGAAIAREAS